ncbi:MAG: response regulator transcription factor [Elusimicrobia bacterium]|nr:response regulator transcription factor [Elusimicrobiota bacterium]
MPYSLLIIAGADKTKALLAAGLKEEFRLEICNSAEQALSHLRVRLFDLAVLESDLPDMPGFTLLRIVREMELGKLLPVIFLSNTRTEGSVAEAFNLGVDDYMAAPYDPRELGARIRAVMRRRQESMEDRGETLSISGISIDPSQRRCVVNGKRLRLPPLEFELLKILMRKAGRVLTRPYLLNTVWDIGGQVDTRSVDAAVSRLRRFLGKRHGKLIETVSKMGYCFKEAE